MTTEWDLGTTIPWMICSNRASRAASLRHERAEGSPIAMPAVACDYHLHTCPIACSIPAWAASFWSRTSGATARSRQVLPQLYVAPG